MIRRFKGRSIVCALLGLVMAAGLLAGLSGKVVADGGTASVSSVEELSAALADESIDHIIITKSLEVRCNTADNTNGTSYFTVSRSMVIEGKSSDITLKRVPASDATNGLLQSIIGIMGNGTYDDDDNNVKGITVSLSNMTLDGGADFGSIEGYDRVLYKNMDTIVSQGAAGRSIVDVYNMATLNLENGLTIQNGFCTYSLGSLNDSAGSCNYGGGVRVDWDKNTGGGTVNVKGGAVIDNCVASNGDYHRHNDRGNGYGGGIGAYSYSHLNVYGGTVKNCSAEKGGALGCTCRDGHGASSSGTFIMNGGELINNSAWYGGAISAYGDSDSDDRLLGGKITNCTAHYGAAVALGEGGSNYPHFEIEPVKTGKLQITNCVSGSADTYPNGQSIGYEGLYLGNNNTLVNNNITTYQVSFRKFKDDTEDMLTLYAKAGESLGDSFPSDPSGNYTFVQWNTSPDGKGDRVTKNYPITGDLIVYARWLMPAEYDVSGDLKYTYGETGKTLEILNAKAPYGGNILYQWYKANNTTVSDKDTKIANEDSSSFTLSKLDAGKYYYYCNVTTSIKDFEPCSKGSSVFTVQVDPKEVTLDWGFTQFVYDGKAKAPTATLNGALDGDDVKIEISGSQIDPGKYTATATLTGADAANYVIANGDESCGFAIDPAFKMPDCVGMNYEEAEAAIEKLLKDNNMTARVIIDWKHNSDPSKNLTVAATAPKPGMTVTTDNNVIFVTVYESYNPSPATPTPTTAPAAKQIRMPNLVGMNFMDAQAQLEKFIKDNGLKATVTIGWGHNSNPNKNLTVASTTPNAGETLTASTDTIIVMVYEGYNPPIITQVPSKVTPVPTTATPTPKKTPVAKQIKMPDLIGKNYKDAQSQLEKFLKDNGLTAQISIGWGHNSNPDKNLTVASTTPNSGETLTASTKTIILMVYEGYNPPAGALTLDKSNITVACGKTAKLNATLTGYSSAVTWTSSDPKIATVDSNGKIKTKMAGTVTITASVSYLSASCTVTVLYKDVNNTKDFWYAPTNYLTAAGVVKGYAKQTEFRPANKCTRAQMVTFIWRLMGEPAPKAKTCKFKDVKEKDYFYKACIWGNEKHIVEGYKDGTFGPKIVCARKHAVTFLWRLAGKPSSKSSKNKFSDVKKSDYFYKATLWASEKKILAGYADGTFRPNGDCLRRQMVTFLYKYEKYVSKKG